MGAAPQVVVDTEVEALADWPRASMAWTEMSYVPTTSGVKVNCVPACTANATAELPDGPASVQTYCTGPAGTPHATAGSTGCAVSVTAAPTFAAASAKAAVMAGAAKVTAAAPQGATTTPTNVGGEVFPVPSLTVTLNW